MTKMREAFEDWRESQCFPSELDCYNAGYAAALAAVREGGPVAWLCEWENWRQYHDESDPLPKDHEWEEKPDHITPLFAAPPLPTIPKETAKQRYDKFMVEGEEEPPVERLRFFCSLALNGQDWIDVEPFFDAITLPTIPEGWKLVPAEPTFQMQLAHKGRFALDDYKAMLAAAPEYAP